MVEDTVKQRIMEFINFKKISQRKFERTAGLSNGYLIQLRQTPSVDKISMILSAYPEINKTWLLSGDGNMLNDNDAGHREVNPEIGSRFKEISDKLFGGDLNRMAMATYIRASDLRKIICDNDEPAYADVLRVAQMTSPNKINIDWLITGQGEMLKSDKPTAIVNYEHRGAPYYNVDFIGGFDLVMNDQTANPDYYIDFPPYNKQGVVWCNVTGHSMEPEIYHGDMIALKDTNETNPNYLPFGEVYALVTDNYRTIKRLSKSDKEGFIRLVPTNPAPEYASQDIPVSHIRKIYQVLVSVKRF